MKIDKIHIKGFRNFDDEKITFQAKTLIIGANDIGKTNLLYAIRLLFDKSLNDIVVTAKPGSGKTFTVVEKISNIMPSLADYQGVITISFTNKASDELKRRCKQHGVEAKQSFLEQLISFIFRK